MYDLPCRLNHSCQPNAAVLGKTGSTLECWSYVKIRKDDEITKMYRDDFFFMETAERERNFPKTGYYFKCECSLCIAPAPERLISDMRRSLLRGFLAAFADEDDFHGVHHGLDAAAVRRQKLNQTMNWSPAGRLTVYRFLLAALLDAEGAVLNSEVGEMYKKAGMLLIKRGRTLSLQELPSPAMRNVDRWAWRACELRPMGEVWDCDAHC